MRDWRARLLAQRQAEEARLRRLDLDETATMASVLLAAGEPAPRDIALRSTIGRTASPPRRGAHRAARRERHRNLAATAQDVPDTLEAAILGGSGCAPRRPSRWPGSGR